MSLLDVQVSVPDLEGKSFSTGTLAGDWTRKPYLGFLELARAGDW